MKIIEIKITVSDSNYNNISATATLADDEDPILAAVELDSKTKEMMSAIIDKDRSIEDFKRNKTEAVDILQSALDYAKNNQAPF